LFKRFNLCTTTLPVVSGLAGGGTLFSETLPSGQQLFVSSLLPANAQVGVYSLSNQITSVAEGQPSNYRLVVENTNNPTKIRFLHVLQGADAGAGAGATVYVPGVAGNPFEGAFVAGVTAMFPVDTLSNNFTSVSYTAPAGTTNHYVTGLTPNASYSVVVQPGVSGFAVTVTPGPGIAADGAGVLAFGKAGSGTGTAPPLFTSVTATASGLQLNGTGGARQTYSVQFTANLAPPGSWTTIGSVTTDGNGNFQYVDTSANSNAAGFYRLKQ